jgi:inorganic pyrophosphatase/exopolyphosphatase
MEDNKTILRDDCQITSSNYLTLLKRLFYFPSIENKCFILGNSSCDMDSALSAYLLSIFENIRNKTIISDESKTNYHLNPMATKIYFPVLNCKRGTLHHRLDEKFVFDKFHIDENEFFYKDDLLLSEQVIKNSKNLTFILVDHSELPEDQKYLREYVDEIYDHHIVPFLDFPNCKKRFIKFPVGSCSTLILANFYLNIYPITIIPPLLAVTAILLDTSNFKKNFYKNRWDDLDLGIYNAILNQTKEQYDVNEYYNQIFSERSNVEKNLALGIDVLFEKDQKRYLWDKNNIMWSSIPISINKVKEKFTLEKILEYLKNNFLENFEYFVINSNIENSNKLFNIISLKKKFDNIEQIKNDLIKICGDLYKNFEFEEKNNIINLELVNSSSRKIMEPLFKQIFNK